MGFLVAVVVGLAVLAAICYALIYLWFLLLVGIFGSSCLIGFLVLNAILGDSNYAIQLLFAIAFGVCMVLLFFKRLQDKK